MNATLSTLYPKYKQFSENTAFTDPYQDLTHLETFNVDPTNSKDFDDAISVDSDRNIVYVHIVDAHEQIVPSSSLDINAALSAFTLYLQNDHIENILPKSIELFLICLSCQYERQS
jgi:exoribonuclease R